MKFFITTPIYYVNDRPHIGHAYSTFVCDALARFHRAMGNEVIFCTGTDENSQKNIEALQKLGETDLQAYLDRMAETWEETWKELGIQYDDFVRTTEERHLKAVDRFWKASMASGDIYKGEYIGKYCTGCERFIKESDLEHDRCPLHPNKDLTEIKEENYFFKLSSYRDELLSYFKAHPDFIQPESRKNEIVRYVEDHLEDISVSRAAKEVEAGIPVPGDDTQKIYVWFDALINYMTVAGFGTDDEKTKKWWPADLHVVGKDIIKFHCALWPAMILSASKSDPLLKEMKDGDGVLPKHVFAHGFFTIDGMKISKSLGNAIDPKELAEKYSLDSIRYFLMKEISFGEDGDFSEHRLKERYASDLGNTFGNLVHRAISMSRKYFDNSIPTADVEAAKTSKVDSIWKGEQGLEDLSKKVIDAYAGFRPDRALEAIWGMTEESGSGLSHANRYIEETKPFKLIKEDEKATAEILYSLLEGCRVYAWLIEPVMPETTEKIINSLGQYYTEEIKKPLSERLTWGQLVPGADLPEPTVLFPRLEQE